ncbi:hypothetical protein IT418_03375 [bacterium]|nr:hypothetical protein [bacterium]
MAQLAGTRNVSNILRTSQQKAISTGLLTFALVVALLWGSFRPTMITIIETNRKYAEKEATLAKLEQQNSNITSLLKDRLDQDEKLAMLDYYFPVDGDFSLYIVNMNHIAKKYGLTMDSVSFSANYFRQVEKIEALQFQEMTPVTFQASLTGDPSNLSPFLSYIENTPFLPKVLSIGYSPNRNNSAKTTMSVTFLLYKLSIPAANHE